MAKKHKKTTRWLAKINYDHRSKQFKLICHEVTFTETPKLLLVDKDQEPHIHELCGYRTKFHKDDETLRESRKDAFAHLKSQWMKRLDEAHKDVRACSQRLAMIEAAKPND